VTFAVAADAYDRHIELPFANSEFDAALARLVVNFRSDPEAGLREMRCVVRPGGVVAGCVWDYPGEMTLLGRQLRRRLAVLDGSFRLRACAWYAVGTV
jgi:SAM-dependent methyltransferase